MAIVHPPVAAPEALFDAEGDEDVNFPAFKQVITDEKTTVVGRNSSFFWIHSLRRPVPVSVCNHGLNLSYAGTTVRSAPTVGAHGSRAHWRGCVRNASARRLCQRQGRSD